MGPIVDVHCHVFNADDLPVRGFSYHLKLHNVPVGGQLARLIDHVLAGWAPDHLADLERLDKLLAAGPPGNGEAALVPGVTLDEFEAAVDVDLATLEDTLLLDVGSALLEAEDGDDAAESGPESLGDYLAAARRGLRWAKLFTLSRLDLAAALATTFPDVVLFTPLLVDLDTGLGDRATTSISEQVVLYEKLSRASMVGALPGTGDARFHPFIGFDPLRELAARRRSDIRLPLEIVQDAILRFGFVGIKVYPQMGWRPSGNTPRPGLTGEDAAELDAIVLELARWCANNDVPITAHGNASNYADDSYEEARFGSPAQWLPVLEDAKGLHLNLGHFGGANKDKEPEDGWPWQIARMAADHAGLFADVGNHRIDDGRVVTTYFAMLAAMFEGPKTTKMSERVMYGSDWFMEAIHPEPDDFLTSYRDTYRKAFGADKTTAFMGASALTFLGFDDPNNANAQRLYDRYQRYAPDQTPTWLASPEDQP